MLTLKKELLYLCKESSFLCIIIYFVILQPSYSTEVSVDNIITSEIEVSDNKFLRTEDEISSTGVIVTSRNNLKARTPRQETNLVGTLRFSRYDQDEGIDRDDQIFSFNTNRKNERSSYGIRTRFTRDSTLTSELEGTGRVQNNRRREKINVSPNLNLITSKNSQLQFLTNHTSVRYPSNDSFSQSAYDNDYYSISYSSVINPKSRYTINVFTSKFDSIDIDSETKTDGINIGFDHAFSPTLSTSFSAGYQDSYFKFRNFFGTTRGSDDGYLLDFTAYKTFQTTTYTLGLSRSLLPSSSGTVYQQDNISIGAVKALKEYVDLSINARWLSNESINQEFTGDDRDYLNTSAQLKWKLNPNISLKASYVYKWQEYENADDDASSNTFFLSFEFRGNTNFL